MKKRIKNKLKKESGYSYKGQYIEKNGPYSFRGNNVVLFYCPIEGMELYFKTVSSAKKYLDSIHFKMITKKQINIPF